MQTSDEQGTGLNLENISGCVKIQSLIRGFLDRKRLRKIAENCSNYLKEEFNFPSNLESLQDPAKSSTLSILTASYTNEDYDCKLEEYIRLSEFLNEADKAQKLR